mmetsp:Transcript_125634/g.351841  ORF Transcript_125634/g.351841 Transcript_125634/m.351841 type:complete len:177 (-) Transcript_125634:317-847(-)
MQNITALGPKNPWTANLLSALGIMHFSNEEIKETFDALTDRGDSIDKARVFELLRAAFGFEPMPEEMGLFVSALQLDEDGEVSWAELEDAFDQIRETLTGVSKNAVEYTSTQDMKDDLIKHRRMKKDPMDKYKGPMTESQSIGWHEEEVFNERFPKNSCAETKYADEMIKSRLDPF